MTCQHCDIGNTNKRSGLLLNLTDKRSKISKEGHCYISRELLLITHKKYSYLTNLRPVRTKIILAFKTTKNIWERWRCVLVCCSRLNDRKYKYVSAQTFLIIFMLTVPTYSVSLLSIKWKLNSYNWNRNENVPI